MMDAPGFNPMRWDCSRDGCFNLKRRPKIEIFADCFPGKIAFGDVDGLVEMNGALCFLEWKGDGGSLRQAQHIAYRSVTKADRRHAVFVVNGDAETMTARSLIIYQNGEARVLQGEVTIESVRERIKAWADWIVKGAP